MKYISINKYIEAMEEYQRVSKKRCLKRNEVYSQEECQNIEIFKKWCATYDIKEYRQGGSNSWTILDSRKRYRRKIKNTPLEDHVGVFRNSNKEIVFINQPYATLKKMDDNNILGFCNERGLDYIISEDLSWHYPKETILVQYSIKDKFVFDAYINQFKVVG